MNQPVDTEIVELIRNLDQREMALLTAKLYNPDKEWQDITSELLSDVAESYRKQIVSKAELSRLVQYFKTNPSVASMLLAVKFLPTSVLELNRLIHSDGVRDNVKATASKELIRMGESATRTLANEGGSQVGPRDQLDKLRNDTETPHTS